MVKGPYREFFSAPSFLHKNAEAALLIVIILLFGICTPRYL